MTNNNCEMTLMHQDWNTIIINKKKHDKPINKKSKQLGHTLDDNKEVFKHTKIDRELSQTIIKRRCELKMNRKELSQKLCIKVDILAKYETGVAIIEPRILNKLKHILKF